MFLIVNVWKKKIDLIIILVINFKLFFIILRVVVMYNLFILLVFFK